MVSTSAQKTESITWKIKLLYDGDCPLCLREVNFLRKRDAGRGIVAFVNIADLNYSPAENGGISYEAAMGRIHALLPDGRILQDVAVFRRVYEELGLGWVYAITKWQPMETIANLVYKLWAALRLPLTGRPNLDILKAQRSEKLSEQSRCRLTTPIHPFK
jgi:predicted DCC family thiol-disulfide oxidoreductase YuxK